uniref:Antimicrobial peptide MBP-1 n=2 Tax=Zea mays TaxID=4577 RepID=MBP1_MAIZE|nr:RecName: Full=Antimicrobial peptide MBP-1 [Zea mays]AAB23306.1 MBP-1=small, acid-soluble, basic anti-microbial peptide [Zea mays=maize, inbred B73, seeds, Peptide, 33 aa] [Zea mays]
RSGRGECRRQCLRRHEGQPWETQECMRRCRRRG